MRNAISKHVYIGIFFLMLSLITPPSSFATSSSDFEAMVKQAEQRRVAIAQKMEASTVFILSEAEDGGFSMGTGFVIKENYVLTNAHVVDKGSRFFIAAKSFSPIEATLIKKVYTMADDFALLQFKQPCELPVLAFNLSLNRTDKVSSWGYPYLVTKFDQNMDKILEGKYANLPPVVYTEGVVSAFVEANGRQSIIHSAAIAAGNSGGPLINTQGDVVGINTWGATTEDEGAFVNASLTAHAAVKFLRSCNVEPTITDSDGPTLAMQEWTPAKPIYGYNDGGGAINGHIPVYARGNGGGNSGNNGNSGVSTADASPSQNAAPNNGQYAISGPSAEAAAQLTGRAKEVYQAALDGNAEAQAYIGVSYYIGDEAPEIESEALYWFQQAAAKGHPVGLYHLALIYLESQTYINPQEGIQCLRRAAVLDDEYLGLLADFLLRGEAFGVPRDAEGGFKAAERGAQSGDARATGLLAYAYATGCGVERDEAKALELAQAAADADDPLGHGVLSMLYAVSDTLDEDIEASIEHAYIAADAGNDMGFGMLALHGILEGDPNIDMATALEYAQEGVLYADEMSQVAMALFCTDEEYGYKLDLSMAWAYLELAARKNSNFAIILRDELASALSEQDIELGKQYIELWYSDWHCPQ